METPVLIIIFKRANLVKNLLGRLREVRPRSLYIACDGPRSDRSGEDHLVEECRAMVDSEVDWDCQIHKLYRKENAGCRINESGAINWFFSHVTEGIILEDDVLPSKTFFKFAEVLLARYKDNEKVMQIGAMNYHLGKIMGDGAYYASTMTHTWGWASWARAWKHYREETIFSDEEIRNEINASSFCDEKKKWFYEMMKMTRDRLVDDWAFQWHYAIMKTNGVSIHPNVNMASNGGVGLDATHQVNQSNGTKMKALELYSYHAPSSLEPCPRWDEEDFYHSAYNKKYPIRGICDRIKYFRFYQKYCQQQ